MSSLRCLTGEGPASAACARGRVSSGPLVLPGPLSGCPAWRGAWEQQSFPAPSSGPPASCPHSERASEQRDPGQLCPGLSPGTRTGRPTLVSRVTVLTAPPSGCRRGADTSPRLLLGRRPARLRSCLLPSALHSWPSPAAPNSCRAGGGVFSVKVPSLGIHPLTWPVTA